ncbi:MAG: Uma2 family endonuclease [Pegethrix bostrychoides GSE-TBD4-15B]|jgi:Uma2 family endonuclease|uniref:Uma2 family endonuclease n=1 Tax=Pegethrix bostrychoides GSE-TBD4-15B TaxID=2839662 RepID=A0A951U619_9CYAN|nr:Uma2 family endonuclease [Pegethrix bostrychoides GSE-TBD4-15B]
MTQAADVTQQVVPQQAVEAILAFPPADLWSDEPPLESDRHRDQIDLLIRLIRWAFCERQDVYVAGNLTVYYSPNQKKSEDFRGPDVFVVLGTENRPRRSWTVWHENGKYPNLIVELLSDSTASIDRGEKKELYQSVWRVPEYFWFDPVTLEFQGFQLLRGQYEPIQPRPQGWLWSDELGLFLGIHDQKLRLFTPGGSLVPLPEEDAMQRAEQEKQRADQEKQRREQLEAFLRSQGFDPDHLPEQ